MRSNIFTQQKNRRYSNLFITHFYFADIIDTASSAGESRLKLNLSTEEMNFTGIFSQGDVKKGEREREKGK